MKRKRNKFLKIVVIGTITSIFATGGFLVGFFASNNKGISLNSESTRKTTQSSLEQESIKLLIQEAKKLNKSTFSKEEFKNFSLSDNSQENVLFDSQRKEYLNLETQREILMPFIVENQDYEAFFNRINLFKYYDDRSLKVTVSKKFNAEEYVLNILSEKNNINEKIVIEIKNYDQKIPIDVRWFNESLFRIKLNDNVYSQNNIEGTLIFDTNQNFININNNEVLILDETVKNYDKLILKVAIKANGQKPIDPDYQMISSLKTIKSNQDIFVKLFLKDNLKTKYQLLSDKDLKIENNLLKQVKERKEIILEEFLNQFADHYTLNIRNDLQENQLSLYDLDKDFSNYKSLYKYSIAHKKIIENGNYFVKLKVKDIEDPNLVKKKNIELTIKNLNESKIKKIQDEVIKPLKRGLVNTNLSQNDFENKNFVKQNLTNDILKKLGFENVFINFENYKDDVDISIEKIANDRKINFYLKYKFGQTQKFSIETIEFQTINDLKNALAQALKYSININKSQRTLEVNKDFIKYLQDNQMYLQYCKSDESQFSTYSKEIEDNFDGQWIDFKISNQKFIIIYREKITSINETKAKEASSLLSDMNYDFPPKQLTVSQTTSEEEYILKVSDILGYKDIESILIDNYIKNGKIEISKEKDGITSKQITLKNDGPQKIYVYLINNNQEKTLIKSITFNLHGLNNYNNAIELIKQNIASEVKINIVNKKSWKEEITKDDIYFLDQNENMKFILSTGKSFEIDENGQVEIEFIINDKANNLTSQTITKTIGGFYDKSFVLKDIIKNSIALSPLDVTKIINDDQQINGVAPSQNWFNANEQKIIDYLNNLINNFITNNPTINKNNINDIKKELNIESLQFLNISLYDGTLNLNILFSNKNFNITKKLFNFNKFDELIKDFFSDEQDNFLKYKTFKNLFKEDFKRKRNYYSKDQDQWINKNIVQLTDKQIIEIATNTIFSQLYYKNEKVKKYLYDVYEVDIIKFVKEFISNNFDFVVKRTFSNRIQLILSSKNLEIKSIYYDFFNNEE